uniref:Uncharacterized protein n=1 Tax=Vespula pensylvanica TaxID=30213 RepID=A0A834PCN2_VESPE|nr:hypothetical protein H0235_003846 [Vespula pensylvanica]
MSTIELPERISPDDDDDDDDDNDNDDDDDDDDDRSDEDEDGDYAWSPSGEILTSNGPTDPDIHVDPRIKESTSCKTADRYYEEGEGMRHGARVM